MSLKKGIRDQGLGISKQPSSNPRLLGLIAGMGDLPMAIALEAKKIGYRVTGIALQPPADESLKDYVDDFYKIRIGRFGTIIKTLKKLSIKETVMAGKVPKSLLYQNKASLMPDIRAVKFLLSLKDYSDDTFMQAISAELKKEGITLLNITAFTKNLLTPEGVLTKKHPQKTQWKDIEFGWRTVKEIGRLDIGQTIIVKDMAVMAVEAIEGTDEAILRGGSLAKENAVVIKASRPQQDMRLDVPVVGINTLLTMKKVKANLLVLEAGKSIIVDKERFIKEADKAEIAVVGINSDK
ncbi:MAG: UDP-2,3-diacylglucosamine diphosphatase LpxI [Thermodesulfovibrionia bacterium]|nr:UDP-2,3-diacylglucosamine diphosphatase LpxI [Thermodesulfovibrionia bacterium]